MKLKNTDKSLRVTSSGQNGPFKVRKTSKCIRRPVWLIRELITELQCKKRYVLEVDVRTSYKGEVSWFMGCTLPGCQLQMELLRCLSWESSCLIS